MMTPELYAYSYNNKQSNNKVGLHRSGIVNTWVNISALQSLGELQQMS